MSLFKISILALSLTPAALSHSWVQQLRNIDDKGNYVGDYGYSRGMIATTDPGYNGDLSMNWQLPQNSYGTPWINDSMPLCHPNQRKVETTNAKYPRLKATPGKFMALRYLENGHTTLKTNQLGKMNGSGTVFVYGTTSPQENEQIGTVLRWTKDGTGGDQRGVLLTTNNFDDGRCYQVNPSAASLERSQATPNYALGQVGQGTGRYELPCETDVQLPTNATTGKPYTLYWVWQWNTQPKIDPGLPMGKDEYYTTCIDVDVVDTQVQSAASPKFAILQQDAMSDAVKGFSTRSAFYTTPPKGEFGPIFSSGASATPTSKGGAAAAPAPAQTTMLTAVSPSGIPILTQRPGDGNNALQASAYPSGVVVVTETKVVTVTAVAPAMAAATPAGYRRDSAKFRW